MAAKKRKKGHHEEHPDESWLIPYADLLTLLLALFIVLYATSNVDSEKFQAMAEAFYYEFNGILPGSGTTLNIGQGDNSSLIESALPATPPPTVPPMSEGTGGVAEQRQAQLSDLESSFKTYIISNNLGEQIKVEKTGDTPGDGLLITLTSDVWFASGSAEITDAHKKIAVEIADMIEQNQKDKQVFKVIVTGHTDNAPISTAQYKNNWYLSIARAVNFMQAVMDDSKLDPANFSARGLGEYSPIDTNDTAEGRAHNRRVEVYISFE